MHKKDIEHVFAPSENYRNLDYIACWFYLAAKFVLSAKGQATFAFVSTNSICQGELVTALWPRILTNGLEIAFAYTSFKWANSAKGTAGVTCVIVGVSKVTGRNKFIFQDGIRQTCNHISPYLTSGATCYVYPRVSRISDLPKMVSGNKAVDGGHLFFDKTAKTQLEIKNPEASQFIRRVWGAKEFLYTTPRWCLWIEEQKISEAKRIPIIANKLKLVKQSRLESPDEGAQALAETPHRFREMLEPKKVSFLMPTVSSEQREYIPVGHLGVDDVIIAPNQAIYDAEMWVFGVISSKIHMVWVKAVAGRLEERIRYSSSICYNTFPFPKINEAQKQELSRLAENLLLEREKYPEKTMAQLYDSEDMPKDLLAAHRVLDAAVEKCYRAKAFASDEERLEYLFAEYEKMTAAGQTELLALEPAKKTKPRKKTAHA
jgi:hypothetical protein